MNDPTSAQRHALANAPKRGPDESTVRQILGVIIAEDGYTWFEVEWVVPPNEIAGLKYMM
jgi:hypothetical protein